MTQNIDNMLATRHMKHATNAMEGQLHSLSAANDQLVTHMAGHAVQVRSGRGRRGVVDTSPNQTQTSGASGLQADANDVGIYTRKSH